MGGAYLTLLNTIANVGVIMPKTPLFAAMDWLTFSHCHDNKGILMKSLTCPKKIRLLTGSSPCTDAGKEVLWVNHPTPSGNGFCLRAATGAVVQVCIIE
jgi:hypothetical protein